MTQQALRHRRVWLRPGMQLADVQGAGGLLAAQCLLDWVGQGRPLVVRSALPSDAADSGLVTPVPASGSTTRLAVGLALAPAHGPRRRLAFTVPAAQVLRIEAPLLLAEAAPVLPAAMQAVADTLVSQAAAIGVAVHVYGSVFWQHAGGGAYLHAGSDLDVLLCPPSAQQAQQCLAMLEHVQTATPLRIDGELEMPGGDAVAWRELAGTSHQVLVKSLAGPRLVPRPEVWLGWTAQVAAAC